VASLPGSQQAAVPGSEQQEASAGPDWQWWRETLRRATKGSSSTSTNSVSMTLSQLSAAAEELESMPEVSFCAQAFICVRDCVQAMLGGN
jgi:hypothetical protein